MEFPRSALIGCAALGAVLVPGTPRAAEEVSPPKIIRVSNLNLVTLPEMVEDLAKARFVFFGEQHSNRDHHAGQLRILKALVERGAKVGIAAEMFLYEDGDRLQEWVAGEMGPLDFFSFYTSRWDLEYWAVYADLFYYARKNRIPLAGINIPREIVKQVAAGGVAALPEAVRKELGEVRCDPDSKYTDLMGLPMFGGEVDAQVFRRFCEAQLTWDISMARNLLKLDAERPGHTWLILAGSFHAWKYGIPARLRRAPLHP